MKNQSLRVVLYSRNGCHLCEEAETLLIAHGIQPDVIDIDTDQELVKQFTNWVPVVEINGKIRFRGRIDPVLLKRVLKT